MHGGAAPQVARRARRRLLDAFTVRALWQFGYAPRPSDEALAMAAVVDRLRRTAPEWWWRIDEQTRYRHRAK